MTGSIRSVSQAFAILRLLADEDALTLSDIGKLIGTIPSSCFNLLKTLEAERVIERDLHTKRYRLAPPWNNVDALHDSAAARLVVRSIPLLGRFAQANEAAVGLWKIVSRDRMQLAAHGESKAGMRLTLADGQRQPLGAGAAGRAIAAAQDVDEVELARRFGSVRWQSELAFETYLRQVGEARANGFAIDDGYAHRGVVTVATALADVMPGFCLTASLFAGSQTERELKGLAAALSRLGQEIIYGLA